MRLAATLVMVSALTLSAAQNNQFVPLPSFPAPGFNQRTAEGAFDILVQVDGEAFLYVQDKNLKYLPLSGAPIQDKGSNYTQAIPEPCSTRSTLRRRQAAGLWTFTKSRAPRMTTPL